ncbi:MAG: alpha/beta hydrolase [Pseudomonadota bacterium]
MRVRGWVLDGVLGVLAAVAVVVSAWQLEAGRAGLAMRDIAVGATPVTVVHRADLDAPAPVVVIAHGFAGARQLMQPFAFALARAGYVAVSFDFIAHGAHPESLPAEIEGVGGAADRLIDQLAAVSEAARALPESDGRHALLGHSMATDLIARAMAAAGPRPEAVVALSLFSPEVTAVSPPNMLVVTGGWEVGLTAEALRVLNLTANALARPDEAIPANARMVAEAGAAAEARRRVAEGDGSGFRDGPAILEPLAGEGDSVGAMAEGTARRVVFAEGVEHIGVLFDPEGQVAAIDWLDRAFGIAREGPVEPDVRGPWIGLLFAGLLLGARPLSRLMPRLAVPPAGAGARWGWLIAIAAVPAVLAPMIVVAFPSRVMPIVLGDYLAKHFFVQGVLTGLALWLAARRGLVAWPDFRVAGRPALWLAAGAVGGWVLLVFALTLHRHAFPFVPTPDRALIIPVLALALIPWFLADEWLTRAAPGGTGTGARALAYAATKVVFVLSLALAVFLDTERLFFLMIVAPVILVFFLVYGCISQWAMRATGHPFVAAGGIALALAWSIAVSFPLFAL